VKKNDFVVKFQPPHEPAGVGLAEPFPRSYLGQLRYPLPPTSVLLAEGSAVAVHRGTRLG
jgi:hypothetical protein